MQSSDAMGRRWQVQPPLPSHLPPARWLSHCLFRSPLSISNLGLAAPAFNCIMLPVNAFFFRSSSLARLDPELFSSPGQVSVLLWAGAYATAARDVGPGGSIWLLFALEKAYYVWRFVKWNVEHDAIGIIKKSFKSKNKHDVLQALFYAGYGVGDLFFGLWFLHAYLSGETE